MRLTICFGGDLSLAGSTRAEKAFQMPNVSLLKVWTCRNKAGIEVTISPSIWIGA